jgi:hypothetical protein
MPYQFIKNDKSEARIYDLINNTIDKQKIDKQKHQILIPSSKQGTGKIPLLMLLLYKPTNPEKIS